MEQGSKWRSGMIELVNYSKKLKGKMVLKNINLKLEAGKIYKVQGPNGCGKTMLLRAIAGLIYPSSGVIKINGCKLESKVAYPVKVGALIENPRFWEGYTGIEMLTYLANIRKEIGVSEIKTQMNRMLLDHDSEQTIAKYSLGMRQKLGIIQSYMEMPDVLLLDEPINALDKEAINALIKVVQEEKERGAVVVVAIHNSGDFIMNYDFVFEMKDGEIINDENVSY